MFCFMLFPNLYINLRFLINFICGSLNLSYAKVKLHISILKINQVSDLNFTCFYVDFLLFYVDFFDEMAVFEKIHIKIK